MYNCLTKYEKAIIISQRITQLSAGDKPLIENIESYDTLETIAEKELEQGKINIIIKRNNSDNTYELWRVKELVQK